MLREFEPFLRHYILEYQIPYGESHDQTLHEKTLRINIKHIVDSPDDNEWKSLLTEAIKQVKLNTRRLVRCEVSSYTLHVVLCLNKLHNQGKIFVENFWFF